MPKVLKYIGKGQWQQVDEAEVLPSDKIQRPTKVNNTRISRIDIFLETVEEDIKKNGYRTIRVATFLQNFGIVKRSIKNLSVVKEKLRLKGFHTLPEYCNELKLDSSLRIYNYPVRQLGDLFQSEKHLEDYVAEYKLYQQLNITSVARQYSPMGTKDKLDFKGDSEKEDIVVLELKNGSGGKSAVEQVLRYAGLLKMQYPQKTIRPILVTGIQNYETALAIRGMQKEQRDLFEWYLYKYQKAINHFEFIKITQEDINFQTNLES